MQKSLVLIFLVASIYAADPPNAIDSGDLSAIYGTLAPEYALYQSALFNFYLTVDYTSFLSEFSKLTNQAYFSIFDQTPDLNDKGWVTSYENALSSLQSDYSKIGLPLFTPTFDASGFPFASGDNSLFPSFSDNASDQQPDETGSVTENGTDQESSETGSVTDMSGSNTAASGSSSSKKESSSKESSSKESSSKESSSKESSSKLSSSGTSSGSKAAAATMYMAPFGAMVGAIGVALL